MCRRRCDSVFYTENATGPSFKHIYPCQVCKDEFSHEEDLLEHLRFHRRESQEKSDIGQEPEKISEKVNKSDVLICNNVDESLDVFVTHEEHRRTQRFSCGNCNVPFRAKEDLSKHLETCVICIEDDPVSDTESGDGDIFHGTEDLNKHLVTGTSYIEEDSVSDTESGDTIIYTTSTAPKEAPKASLAANIDESILSAVQYGHTVDGTSTYECRPLRESDETISYASCDEEDSTSGTTGPFQTNTSADETAREAGTTTKRTIDLQLAPPVEDSVQQQSPSVSSVVAVQSGVLKTFTENDLEHFKTNNEHEENISNGTEDLNKRLEARAFYIEEDPASDTESGDTIIYATSTSTAPEEAPKASLSANTDESTSSVVQSAYTLVDKPTNECSPVQEHLQYQSNDETISKVSCDEEKDSASAITEPFPTNTSADENTGTVTEPGTTTKRTIDLQLAPPVEDSVQQQSPSVSSVVVVQSSVLNTFRENDLEHVKENKEHEQYISNDPGKQHSETSTEKEQ